MSILPWTLRAFFFYCVVKPPLTDISPRNQTLVHGHAKPEVYHARIGSINICPIQKLHFNMIGHLLIRSVLV